MGNIGWKGSDVVAQAQAEAVKGITSPMVGKPSEASFGRTARGEANRSKIASTVQLSKPGLCNFVLP